MFMPFNPFERVAVNQQGMVGHNVGRGSLISFHYPFSHAMPPNPIHDPYPLVLVTDIWPQYLRGVNMHYLTFPYIRNILQRNCGNASYSYGMNVKSDRYVASAFRMYYRSGMRNVKKMDCQFLVQLLKNVRSFSQTEIERIRQEIQQQIRQRLQMRADELAKREKSIAQQAEQLRNTLQQGVTQNLMQPQQYGTGRNPANYPLPPAGPFSTADLPAPPL